jgi:hypothetical protein
VKLKKVHLCSSVKLGRLTDSDRWEDLPNEVGTNRHVSIEYRHDFGLVTVKHTESGASIDVPREHVRFWEQPQPEPVARPVIIENARRPVGRPRLTAIPPSKDPIDG